MTPPRAVITGMGVITPLGHTLAATCDGLRRNGSAFARPSLFDASRFAEPLAAEVREFDASPYLRVRKAMKLAHRVTRFAVAAAAMALADGGWPDERSREDLGVIIGTSSLDPQNDDLARALAPDPGSQAVTDVRFFAERILSGLNPLWLVIGLPNMASSHVAIQLEARGPNSTVMTDWIAGSQAIGEALQWIQSGEAKAVLAGGADTALFPLAYACYEQAGMLGVNGRGHDAPRFIPGEGAAVVLLEEREHALERGARLKGEIRAYAASTGVMSRDINPSGNPLIRTMQRALVATDTEPSGVTMLGTASVFAEPHLAVEEQAVSEVLGPMASRVPRVEFKSRLGHGFGAAGAIDVALLLELHGRGDGGTILCNALGYGGQASTLVLGGAGWARRAS